MYVNLIEIRESIPWSKRSKKPDHFLNLPFVSEYGEKLSNDKYGSQPYRKVITTDRANRGQTHAFPEIAEYYKEWLNGKSGWEIKKMMVNWIDPVYNRVYLIRCGEYYKIGSCRDLAARIRSLQWANPYDLTLLGEIKVNNYQEVEKELHEKYTDHLHRNEWFQLPPSCVEEILGYFQSHGYPHTRRESSVNPGKTPSLNNSVGLTNTSTSRAER